MRYDDGDDDTFTALDTRTGKRVTLVKRAMRPDATVADTLKAWPNSRSFNAVLARQEAEELAKAMADDEPDDQAPVSDHPVSRLADILVESSRFPDRASALTWLTSHPNGHALVRTHKAEKELPSMQERLQEIVKRDGGLVALAKVLIEDQSAHGITEAEFTAAVTEHAQRLYPDKTPDAAFVKLFSDSGADGVAIRKAHALTKGVYDIVNIEPMMVGGPDAMHAANDDTEQSEAYAQLEAMASRLRATSPWLTAEQAFDRVFTDKRNASLAAKAHVRPSPTASYAWPR
jgi:hypothetical protein